ncbi:MAG TPA: hypothetical protein VLE02_01770 [Nitrosarchaeum sp.]|nr:hypothetical protein [Nitrosarchaeum sp.]
MIDFDEIIKYWVNDCPYICINPSDVNLMQRVYITGSVPLSKFHLIQKCGTNPTLQRLCQHQQDLEIESSHLLKVNGSYVKFPKYTGRLFTNSMMHNNQQTRGMKGDNLLVYLRTSPPFNTVGLKYEKPISLKCPAIHITVKNEQHYTNESVAHRTLNLFAQKHGYVALLDPRETYPGVTVRVNVRSFVYDMIYTYRQLLFWSFFKGYKCAILPIHFDYRDKPKTKPKIKPKIKPKKKPKMITSLVMIFLRDEKVVYVFDPEGEISVDQETRHEACEHIVKNLLLLDWALYFAPSNRIIQVNNYCSRIRFSLIWCLWFLEYAKLNMSEWTFKILNMCEKYASAVVVEYDNDVDAYIEAYKNQLETVGDMKSYTANQYISHFVNPPIPEMTDMPSLRCTKVFDAGALRVEIGFLSKAKNEDLMKIYLTILRLLYGSDLEIENKKTKSSKFKTFQVINRIFKYKITTQSLSDTYANKIIKALS